jgi:hypothetical protein
VAGFQSGGGGERTVYMASTKQVKLYWVTARDHVEDWFIFAESARKARAYHEHYEGYDKGEAHSRLIVSNVTLKEFQNGTPPCNATYQDLAGYEDGTLPSRNKAGLNGEIFREGILEAIIELGRQQPAVTMRENGGRQLKEASPSTTAPESAPGLETGPRLVN